MSEQGPTMEIRAQAEELGDAVREQAYEAKEAGSQELRSQLDRRTTHVGRQASLLARELRKAGASLQAQDGDAGTARLTAGLAGRLERAGNYLERVSGDELLRDAEDLARRSPWLVAGAAAAAGLAASRFLKASSERRYDQRRSTARPDGVAQTPALASDGVTSMGYPAPPTVPVGPAETAPVH